MEKKNYLRPTAEIVVLNARRGLMNISGGQYQAFSDGGDIGGNESRSSNRNDLWEEEENEYEDN